MKYTLIGIGAASILAMAGASPFFIPALLALGIASDANTRKDTK